MSPKHRDNFKRISSSQWYDGKVFIQPTHCHSVEAWIAPCNLTGRYSAKNDEEKDNVIDAEESLTIGEDDTPPPFIASSTYIQESVFDYNSCLTDINDDTDNNTPIIIGDDDDPDNTPGLPIKNIR